MVEMDKLSNALLVRRNVRLLDNELASGQRLWLFV
jgi:hypothetical protein